ncbi:YraN family protein [Sediminibacterium soli]|uniref:YraN family protein n=1 Tax=Sediminibacterium soli TaxID=2698829 RepID=UPI00137B66D1|nr:YraN family protein [Sediminibacterium soli]NCI46002.1 YraN family protein [Sediminibacterium soli]
MQSSNRQTGEKGEEMAAAFLSAKGYRIIERNWRFRHWEADIIAARGDRLHFIEVKTRQSLRYGRPEESISREKMNHLKQLAEEYQYRHPKWKYIQFDVMAITVIDETAKEVFLIEDVYF